MKKVDDLLESYMGIRDTELGEYTVNIHEHEQVRRTSIEMSERSDDDLPFFILNVS